MRLPLVFLARCAEITPWKTIPLISRLHCGRRWLERAGIPIGNRWQCALNFSWSWIEDGTLMTKIHTNRLTQHQPSHSYDEKAEPEKLFRWTFEILHRTVFLPILATLRSGSVSPRTEAEAAFHPSKATKDHLQKVISLEVGGLPSHLSPASKWHTISVKLTAMGCFQFN